ncbi:Cdc48-dependent protein degradation adaptor protein-like protein [Phyllosticta citribraziliensis]|uniref:Cdc48-dependent protein degradation adaptor protein-like protein n=1 Tax=Phyllosticta citribraziliensis TaxID=989973 RepID=A0ABR1MCR9_9PEZI
MAEPSGAERDALISEFCSVTGVGPQQAENALKMAEWDVPNAVQLHYTAQDDAPEASAEDAAAAEAPSDYTGPRTLGGAPAPAPAQAGSSSSSSAQQSRSRGGLRTIRDLQGEGGAAQGHGHAHDDDDDDEDQDFFAGGEKSGLAVQNPNRDQPSARDHINNIIDRARRNVPRPGGDDEEASSRPTVFRGEGRTLGGDDAPSVTIPDPTSSAPRRPERVRRVMHLWRDGFSIDDGRLYRYDDPANRGLLEMINSGRAPLDILEVEHNQEVDLEVYPHKDEDYVAPKPKYKPFSGQGQRLGSPTPAAASGSSTPTGAAASSSAAAAPSSSAAPASAPTPSVNVDDAAPTLTMQIRLGDGTRLQSRFNTTHTIGDLYGFVNAASPASLQREYVLMTTFPNKDLEDKSLVLGDMAEFKRGGVVVQKWK